jgi:hypothetical protein
VASKQAQGAGLFSNQSLRLQIGQFDARMEGITACAVALKLHLKHPFGSFRLLTIYLSWERWLFRNEVVAVDGNGYTVMRSFFPFQLVYPLYLALKLQEKIGAPSDFSGQSNCATELRPNLAQLIRNEVDPTNRDVGRRGHARMSMTLRS